MPFPSGRRTIHDFTTEPVEEAAVARAFAAAQEAPCHKLTWPWRFTRVGQAGKAALIALNKRLKGAGRALTPAQEAKLEARMGNPELIVVSQVLAADPMRRKEDYAAVACAVQNLCLSLHVDGIGSKWGTGGVTRHPEAYALLGVDPALEEIVGFLWIGHAADVVPRPPRPPLDEVVRSVP
ncbi:MAG: nitroreductase family protein [Alphaproteobacteria bacterium]|nr:nitroreductase family protein [Alphaproteobacteria bacterium]